MDAVKSFKLSISSKEIPLSFVFKLTKRGPKVRWNVLWEQLR